ncbi:MAG: PAS domain S-box protein [Opitutales bacterium]|nr:PAS domain S-box protein [Opitutales bacterium]
MLPLLSFIGMASLNSSLLFDKHPHPMLVYDLDSLRLLAVNEAMVRDYGYTEAELLELTISDLHFPEDLPALEANVSAVTEGIDKAGIWRHLCKDGRIRHAEIVSEVIDFEGRRSELVVAIDRTGQVESRLRLQAQQSLLEVASRLGRIGAWAVDLPQVKHQWTDEAREIHGVGPDFQPDLETLIEFYVPEQREKVRRVFTAVGQTGRGFEEEFQMRRPDGALIWVRVIADAVKNDDGEVIRINGAIQDITRQRLERVQLKLLAEALNSAADPVMMTNVNGEIIWINLAFTELTGYPEAESLGRTPIELLDAGEHDEAFHQAVWDHIRAGQIWQGEFINRRKDGSLYPEFNTITPIRDEDGVIRHFFAIKRDLTADKRREEFELRAQRMQSIGTLAGGIAHDLNNLMAPIMMGTGLLKELNPNPQAAQILSEIERNIRRSSDLVKQVLTFARGTSGARNKVSLHILVQDLRLIIASTFPKDIEFVVEGLEDIPEITGDATQIHQVLINLCVNARDAMRQGGELTIRFSLRSVDALYVAGNPEAKEGEYVRIDVCDTGEGMSKAVKARVFEPFYTTKAFGEGTGLGLSTAIGIVRSHDGFITVYSEPGKGSEFQVYFPLFAGPDDVTEDVGASVSEESVVRGSGQCILVVDDEEGILNTTAMTLEAFGYKVITAADGIEALAVYAKSMGSIDLVITDLMMPNMDGPTLIAAIQRIDPELPIIAASGLEANGRYLKATQLGIRNFVSKPCSTQELLSVVARVLDL